MRICFLSDAGSEHTKKWCNWFHKHGHEVFVVSLTHGEIENVVVRVVETGANARGNELGKLRYFMAVPQIRKIVNEISPDILNAHYATSYGTIAALIGYKNYVRSIWGSDIYEFPKKSILHKLLLEFSLHKARYIFSTSNAMAHEAKKYTSKTIEITPFGVDMQLFCPNKRISERNKIDDSFIVGTVKTLVPKYGIDYLIKAVAIIKRNHKEIPIRLRIAGKGEYESKYKTLAEECGVSDITEWLGFISQQDAAKEWANMDVAVVASTEDSESFGVSAVEAEACGTPVIISDIPGLMEATSPNYSSMVVPRKNEEALAKAIIELFYDHKKRQIMGENGRKYVIENYSIDGCFRKIEEKFEMICNSIN